MPTACPTTATVRVLCAACGTTARIPVTRSSAEHKGLAVYDLNPDTLRAFETAHHGPIYIG